MEQHPGAVRLWSRAQLTRRRRALVWAAAAGLAARAVHATEGSTSGSWGAGQLLVADPATCAEAAYRSDADCEAAAATAYLGADPALTELRESECAGTQCATYECCAAPQPCARSRFRDDASCEDGPDSQLTQFQDYGCNSLRCSQRECCRTPPDSCTTVGGDSALGSACAFPFMFRGSIYNTCIGGGAGDPSASHIAIHSAAGS